MAKKTKPQDRKLSTPFQQELAAGVIPEITSELAMVFAKMLSIGCPPARAVLYCAPKLDIDTAQLTARQWLVDRETLLALENLLGGAWMDMPIEQRAKLALDKTNAEAAFYLWTVNFGDIEHREGLDKMKLARELCKSVLGEQPDASDPMAAFAMFAHQLAQNMANQTAHSRRAPQTKQESSLDALLTTKQPH